jgi:small-conductance mechanosensitive channel
MPSQRTGRRNETRRSRARRLTTRGRHRGTGRQLGRARGSLRRFRKATLLAVALTSLLLLFLGADAEALQPDSADAFEEHAAQNPSADDVAQAVGTEVVGVWRTFADSIAASLPKLAVVLGLVLVAWILVRLIRLLLHKTLGHWPKSSAAIAVSAVVVWLFAIGLSTTVIVGDLRAFVGSVGLLGLALSWALQVPIESFTGWLLNSFKGYYRVGDRVEVGEVFGDVHRIDVLTTTVWEIGSPFRDNFVHAEQPTGRLITFPNNEILTGAVMNFTRDFDFVWDELAVPVANESHMRHAMEALNRVATQLLGGSMAKAAKQYEQILRRAGLSESVAPQPQVFISLQDSWTHLTIRYLVPSRERRRWKSDLVLSVTEELAKPEHQGRILPVLPRQQVQFIGADGQARDPAALGSGTSNRPRA